MGGHHIKLLYIFLVVPGHIQKPICSFSSCGLPPQILPWYEEMAQQADVLSSKSDNLLSVPEIHMVEGERRLSYVIL